MTTIVTTLPRRLALEMCIGFIFLGDTAAAIGVAEANANGVPSQSPGLARRAYPG
jgi:hypothetical protein